MIPSQVSKAVPVAAPMGITLIMSLRARAFSLYCATNQNKRKPFANLSKKEYIPYTKAADSAS